MNVLRWVRPGNDFSLSFPIFSRADVNGENRIPLYQWVTSRCPPPVPFIQDPHYLYYNPISSEDIRWNFEKVLMDRTGQPYRRYASSVEPEQLMEDILLLLAM
jgi:glutathione peroxidase